VSSEEASAVCEGDGGGNGGGSNKIVNKLLEFSEYNINFMLKLLKKFYIIIYILVNKNNKIN
jgi:hypothetical protein